MTNSRAPERIWLDTTPDGIDPMWYGEKDPRPLGDQPPWPEIEYTRTDLYDAVVAERDELAAEVERMKALSTPAVEVCPICDIAGCRHIRERKGTAQ